MPTATGPQAVVTKGTCCLIYKAGGRPGDRGAAARLIAPAACTSCPLRREDDRARRFAAYLDVAVELRGIEPLTSSMPWKRSTN